MFGIGEVIGGISNIFSTWLSGRQQKQKAKLDMQLAEMNNKSRLLQAKESNNHAWEMANLTDKDKFLRRLSFCMFSSPFVVAIFFPEHIRIYFQDSISVVPQWWQQTFMAITGGIWGLSSLKNVVPGVVAAFRKPRESA